MKILAVHASREYDILFERGILPNCGEYIRQITGASKALIITDSNVASLYFQTVKHSLLQHGFAAFDFVFAPGESSKTITTVTDMLNRAAECGLTRKDIIVALGGGVVGDMAGFAAAVYLRGIDFVQIPTSLLAQIDSSIGGKTGVDLPTGKNLAGAFWQPRRVIIDSGTLSTLPPEFFCDGMAELIKHACIKSEPLFELLATHDISEHLDDAILQSLMIKRDVVVLDEHERGQRMLLNFGHTIGHSIEKALNFSGISHGQAVAIGMIMLTRATEAQGLTEPGTSGKIEKMLKKYGLSTHSDIPLRQIANGIAFDKKAEPDGINFVLLRKIGDSYIKKIAATDVENFIAGRLFNE